MEASPMSNPSAISKVFGIPLLLEAILLNLPHADLLLNAQRVNNDFRTLILSSPVIQRKLFFQADSTSDSQNRPVEFNPLLKHFRGWFNSAPVELSSENSGYIWEFNPKFAVAFARPEASWRRMYPAQPVAHILSVVKTTHARGGGCRESGKKKFQAGLKMGLLYDYIWREMSWWGFTAFYIVWDSLKMEVGSGVAVEDGQIKIVVRHLVVCCPPLVERSMFFKSKGYEMVDINLETM